VGGDQRQGREFAAAFTGRLPPLLRCRLPGNSPCRPALEQILAAVNRAYDFVQSDRSVGILMDGMPTEIVPLLDQLPERGIPFWFSVRLWDRDNSPSPVLQYVPQQKYFVVDRLASEVMNRLSSRVLNSRREVVLLWLGVLTHVPLGGIV